MAKTLTAGYTDTAISGVSSLNFPRGLVNIQADWKEQTSDGNSVVFTNLKAPLDRPETIRISWSMKNDAYAASGVDPSVRPPSKKGVSFVCQHTRVLTCVDDASPNFRQDVPITVHTVCSFPMYELLTADMLQVELGRMLSGLFDTGSTATARLAAIMRGAVQSSEV